MFSVSAIWFWAHRPRIGYRSAMPDDEQLRIEAQRAAYWCRWYADQRGISLDALAVYSGVGRTSIMEMANRAPSLRTLSSIAKYLGIQVRDLLQDMPDEPKKD